MYRFDGDAKEEDIAAAASEVKRLQKAYEQFLLVKIVAALVTISVAMTILTVLVIIL